MKKITNDIFKQKAVQVHGNKYCYDKVNYINAKTKVCITCPEHGEFWQTPDSHLRGRGCPKCSGKLINTTEEFINKAKEVHNNKYTYNKCNYITAKQKVIITCPIHGDFEQTPDAHIRLKQGCPKCKADKTSKCYRKDIEVFINQASKIHNNKYDYSKFNYVNSSTKGTIICPIHGEFKQTPSNHLSGKGCPECGKLIISLKNRLTNNEVLDKCKKVHPEYIYPEDFYNYSTHRIKFICPKHGMVEQNLWDHIYSWSGCPKCNRSHGERFISNYLDLRNIVYQEQYKVPISIEVQKTGYAICDFYLPTINTIIEYNGIQHYVPVEKFGGKLEFQHQQKRDWEIRNYCLRNNIRLIEIHYGIDFNTLELYLDEYLLNTEVDPPVILPKNYFYKLIKK